MADEGLVEKLGHKRSTKYLVKPRAQRDSGLTIGCFSLESKSVIDLVRRPIYERKPVAYADHWIESYHPNETFYVPTHVRAQLNQAGNRSKGKDPAGTYAHQIFNRLLIDLSYNSSRLEGNTYSLLDTKRLILEGADVEGKWDEEKIMILNHKEAIHYIVDNAPRIEISEQTICTLHYLLADGLVESGYTGKVRDYGVRIGGSTYIPFEEKKELQLRFKRIIEKAAAIVDPYEQSLFLLIQISYLQAFLDVNKRTARLSANIPLIKNNLVPLSFNDVEKNDYTSAMIAIYELQDVRPLLDLYVFSYMRTCAMYDSTVKAMGFDETRVRYRQVRREIIRNIILDQIFGDPLLTYVKGQMSMLVKKEDQSDFFDDLMEDLNEIDLSRLAGLGITPEQFNLWNSLRGKSA